MVTFSDEYSETLARFHVDRYLPEDERYRGKLIAHDRSAIDILNLFAIEHRESRPWLIPNTLAVAYARRFDHERGLPWIPLAFKPEPHWDMPLWARRYLHGGEDGQSYPVGALPGHPSVGGVAPRGTVRFTLRIPVSLRDMLATRADLHGMSVNTLILLILQGEIVRG